MEIDGRCNSGGNKSLLPLISTAKKRYIYLGRHVKNKQKRRYSLKPTGHILGRSDTLDKNDINMEIMIK
jgi:hypothetical protein